MIYFILIVHLLFFVPQDLLAKEGELCSGFLPENSSSLTLNELSKERMEEGISEQEFIQISDAIVSLFQNQALSLGGNLMVRKKWESSLVNASASREGARGENWIITMHGGLARHPQMTKDGFAVVVCHEIGHHLGGAPKKRQAFQVDSRWSSVEGQADYFSSLKCLKEYYQKINPGKVPSEAPEILKMSCDEVFPGKGDSELCQRSALAGLSVSHFLAVIAQSKTFPRFETPSSKKVWSIETKHTDPQCRLDSFFQGALCDRPLDELISHEDIYVGACAKRNGDLAGFRPRCWMKAH